MIHQTSFGEPLTWRMVISFSYNHSDHYALLSFINKAFLHTKLMLTECFSLLLFAPFCECKFSRLVCEIFFKYSNQPVWNQLKYHSHWDQFSINEIITAAVRWWRHLGVTRADVSLTAADTLLSAHWETSYSCRQ